MELVTYNQEYGTSCPTLTCQWNIRGVEEGRIQGAWSYVSLIFLGKLGGSSDFSSFPSQSLVEKGLLL